METQRPGSPLSTGYIKDSSSEEITTVLKYVAFLIGLPDYKKPDAEIIPYMQRKWGYITLKEITDAFESACENMFINVSLDGKTFNPAFMMQVIMAYREFNKKQKKVEPDARTTNQQAATVFQYYKQYPELFEQLKKIGNTKAFKSQAELKNNKEKDDVHQKIMRDFDKLYEDQEDMRGEKRLGIRAVKYDRRMLSLDDYMNVRLDEIYPERIEIRKQEQKSKQKQK